MIEIATPARTRLRQGFGGRELRRGNRAFRPIHPHPGPLPLGGEGNKEERYFRGAQFTYSEVSSYYPYAAK